jgi:hypothetical protein
LFKSEFRFIIRNQEPGTRNQQPPERNMKTVGYIISVIAMIFFFSCEDQGLIVKCPDCVSDEPVKTSLEVKLSSGYKGAFTLINVYEGNLEDSILYNTYNVSATYTTIPVTLNKKYTLTATYYHPDNYYVTIDEATPRVKFEKNQCDDPCYFVYDKEVDLRLKYTK